ncbi:MAG: gamma carbonic anhydrase family protein [Chloroflexi bacterium]|nr:gamma carbonic anhydrase family protein [Chloroflexota bacterium]
MEPLGRGITVALALAAAFAAAAWVAGAIWAHYDIGRRTQDLYVRMFATLMVLLLGPIGAVLYLILRPRETLDDAYLRALQEEVLLRDMGPSPAAESEPSLLAINGKAPTIGRGAFVAPGAKLIGDVRLGDGASVWFNTVIRADIAPVIIGAGTNIQDGCVLHVDPGVPLRIGADVTVGHMAVLHACIIEDECLIGIQSTVLSGAHVRRHSIVGAAALVPENKEFPESSLLVGVPARPMRDVTAQEIQHLIVERAAEYRALAADERDAGHNTAAG